MMRPTLATIVAAVLAASATSVPKALLRGQGPAPGAARPAFTNDVAPIIFKHCASCHRSNGSAPFSLLNYADVRVHANQIATAVGRRTMPPWKPEPGHGVFRGERRLNEDEIATLVRWASEPVEGDPAALPPMPTYP